MANVKFSALPSASSLANTDILAVTQGGVSKQATFSLLPANASLQTVAVSPTQTASVSGVMMGLGSVTWGTAVITPVTCGKIWASICGTLRNDVIGGQSTAQMYYGTGTAPNNGAAITGTAIGSSELYNPYATVARVPFCLNAVITGLTINTQIWLDVVLAASTGGGNALILNVAVCAFEL